MGSWHTHPAKDVVLTNCPTAFPGRKAQVGPSKPDDFNAQKQVDPLPAYMMDKDDVYRIMNKPATGFWSVFSDPQTVKKESWKSCRNWLT